MFPNAAGHATMDGDYWLSRPLSQRGDAQSLWRLPPRIPSEVGFGMFEYLKKFPTHQIAIDARPLKFVQDMSRFRDFYLDFLGITLMQGRS